MGCKTKTNKGTKTKSLPIVKSFECQDCGRAQWCCSDTSRPVSTPSFDPYHLCSFWALSLSPVLSKQFKNLKSLGTVPSSGYTIPWNQRREGSTAGALLLPQFPLGPAGPKGHYLFWYFADFSSLSLEFFRSRFWVLYQQYSTAKWSTLLLGGWWDFHCLRRSRGDADGGISASEQD